MTSYEPVAVIIPFFNGLQFIERAVRSVVNQSISAHEFVVVDDGSRPSESRGLVNLAEEVGFTVVWQKNAGQSAARNTGVAHSSSRLICFLDQDDYFLPGHIETLLSAWKSRRSPSVGYAYGDAQRVDIDGAVIHERTIRTHSLHPKKTTADFLSADMFILPSASIISRQMFSEIGGFHPDLRGYEDDDFFLRAHIAGFEGIHLDRPVVAWTLNLESSSHSPTMASSRLVYLRRVDSFLNSLPDMQRQVLGRLVYPRFLATFAYECLVKLSVGGDDGTAQSRYREVWSLCRQRAIILPTKTHVGDWVVRAVERMPSESKRLAARFIVSRPLRQLRSMFRGA